MRTCYEHRGKACGSMLSKQMIAASDADTAYSPLLIRYLKAAFSDSPSEPLDHLFTNSDCNRRPSFWIEKKKYQTRVCRNRKLKIEEIEIEKSRLQKQTGVSLPFLLHVAVRVSRRDMSRRARPCPIGRDKPRPVATNRGPTRQVIHTRHLSARLGDHRQVTIRA